MSGSCHVKTARLPGAKNFLSISRGMVRGMFPDIVRSRNLRQSSNGHPSFTSNQESTKWRSLSKALAGCFFVQSAGIHSPDNALSRQQVRTCHLFQAHSSNLKSMALIVPSLDATKANASTRSVHVSVRLTMYPAICDLAVVDLCCLPSCFSDATFLQRKGV